MRHEFLDCGVVDFGQLLQVVVVVTQTIGEVGCDGRADPVRVQVLRHERLVEAAQEALERGADVMHDVGRVERQGNS